MSFEENILLKIKRDFSKDEKFAFILDQLSKAQLENGILKSEISELRYRLDQKLKPSKETMQQLKEKGWHKEFLKDDYIIELRKTIEVLEAKCKEENVTKVKSELEKVKRDYAGLKCQLALKNSN